MSRKPSPAQIMALNTVHRWREDDVYTPYAGGQRPYDACVRHGWMEHRPVGPGQPVSGYALTAAGERVRAEMRGEPSSASPLSSALTSLMAMDAPSIRRDPNPAKPGFYWAVFDDGRSFDMGDWDMGFPKLGPGPHIVRIGQDPDYGDWFGTMFHGGALDFEKGLSDRYVRLSFPITVVGQRSSVTSQVRVTWLGEVMAPDVPEAVAPFDPSEVP